MNWLRKLPASKRRDARLLFCTACLLTAAAAALQIAADDADSSGAPDRPVLLIENADWDLGEVVEGTVLETTMAIANGGTRRLVVNEQTCALCGDGALPTLIVSPGQTREVTLPWEIEGTAGPLRQSRRFTTNDPRRPCFTVAVSAVVVHSPTAEATTSNVRALETDSRQPYGATSR